MPGLSGPTQRGKGWTPTSKPRRKQGRRPKRSKRDVQGGGNLSIAAVALGPPPEEPEGVLEQLEHELESVGAKVSDAAEAAVDKLKDLFDIGDK